MKSTYINNVQIIGIFEYENVEKKWLCVPKLFVFI